MKEKKEFFVERMINENITEQLLKETYRTSQDGPWYKIGEETSDRDLNDTDRQTLLKNSRDRYYKTPEGRNLIENAKHFIIGKGVIFKAQDENPKVQEEVVNWWNHKENKMELRQKEIVTRSLRDAECFIRFFDGPDNYSYIRFIDPDQIKNDDIEYDKNDAEKVISYTRKWTPKKATKPEEEKILAENIIHIKLFADLDMKRGRFYIENVIKRLIELDSFIDGRIRRNRLAAAFLLEKILHGKGASSEAISSVEGGMTDASTDSTKAKASKKMPKIGSMVIHNDAVEYKFTQPNIGANDASEDGRLIKLSICAGVNAPEYMLSDASNANYASTMVAENPYVRAMEDLQDTFEEYFKMIFAEAIKRMIKSNKIPANSTQTIVKERAFIKDLIPKVKKGIIKTLREALVEVKEQKPISTKTEVNIEFPPMIHKELKADTEAYQIHSTMGWAADETLAAKLGYDPVKEKEKIDKQREETQAQEKPEEEVEKQREEETKEE